MSERLNPKQLKFIELYTNGMSATEAYMNSGYEVATPESAASCASRMLRNAKILETIDRIQVERMEKLVVTPDWVLERLRLVYLKAVDDGDSSAALKALDMLAKHVGIYAEDNRQKTGLSNLDALKAKLRSKGVNLDAEPSKN